MKDKIRLRQILPYLTGCEPADKIQIVFKEQEWDDFTEVRADSKLLENIQEYFVDDLGVEFGLEDSDRPVIRVSISKEEK